MFIEDKLKQTCAKLRVVEVGRDNDADAPVETTLQDLGLGGDPDVAWGEKVV